MIVEGFHGPGGWAEGRRLLGLTERAVGMEWDAAACATAVAAGHTVIRCDVAAYPTAPFKGRVKGKVDSPPCQAWSRAGKGLGLLDQPLVHQAVEDLANGRDTRAHLLTACKDKRSLLAAEPMRWHYDLRPEWIAMEEVPDVLPLWKQYAEVLRGWGYSVWAGILNAADYGVPQTRRRAILIASRVRAVTAPEPTHAEHAQEVGLFGTDRNRWVSMAESLGWTAGVTVNTRGERTTPGGNEFSADGPAQTLVKSTRSWVLQTNRGHVRPDGERQLVDPEQQPAPTVTTKTGEQWVLRSNSQAKAAVRGLHEPASTLFFGHRCNEVAWTNGTDKRGITQAEAAILQSFPADYPWRGSKTKQFEQIGNAMPPLLAAVVLDEAAGHLAGLAVAS